MRRATKAPHGQCAVGIVTGKGKFSFAQSLEKSGNGKICVGPPRAALPRDPRAALDNSRIPSPHRLGPVNGCVLDKPPSTGKAWPLT